MGTGSPPELRVGLLAGTQDCVSAREGITRFPLHLGAVKAVDLGTLLPKGETPLHRAMGSRRHFQSHRPGREASLAPADGHSTPGSLPVVAAAPGRARVHSWSSRANRAKGLLQAEQGTPGKGTLLPQPSPSQGPVASWTEVPWAWRPELHTKRSEFPSGWTVGALETPTGCLVHGRPQRGKDRMPQPSPEALGSHSWTSRHLLGNGDPQASPLRTMSGLRSPGTGDSVYVDRYTLDTRVSQEAAGRCEPCRAARAPWPMPSAPRGSDALKCACPCCPPPRAWVPAALQAWGGPASQEHPRPPGAREQTHASPGEHRTCSSEAPGGSAGPCTTGGWVLCTLATSQALSRAPPAVPGCPPLLLHQEEPSGSPWPHQPP